MSTGTAASGRDGRTPGWSAALALAASMLATSALGLPAAWEPRGPGGGGALFSPSLSPHAQDEMFVACDMTELFRTRDFGRSWTQADFRVIQGNRASQVWFTPDPSVLYTIDHSTRNLTDLREPVRSADGGATWTPLSGDPTFASAHAMAVDPNDGNRVFVVDYMNLYFSSDAGGNFRQIYTDATGGGCYIAGIFTDGDLIFLGLNAGLLVSTDGGLNFQLNPGLAGIDFGNGGEGMTGFAGAKEAGQVRLLCVTHDRASVYLDMYGSDHWNYRAIYTLDWGVGDWVARTTGITAGAHPFYAGMTANDIDTAWVGGGSDWGSPTVFRTTNGGLDWSDVFLTGGNVNIATGWQGQGGDRGWGYGECALGFGVSPVNPLRAAITDFGYVHVTDDGGATWRQAYVDPASQNPAGANTPPRRYYASVGLENTTAWWLHWATPAAMIGCYSDIRGTRSEDAGLTWGFDYTGHSDNSMYHVVERPSDGMIFAATASVHDMYQSTRLGDGILDAGTGRVLFSIDDGSTWQLLHDFGDVVVWLALDPADGNTLYASVVNNAAGTGGIWRTRNAHQGAASAWTQLAAPPRTQGHPFNIHVLDDGTLLATCSGRRDGGGAFTASSGVFVSIDGGQSWLDRSDPGMRYWTKDVVVDPNDVTQSTWYVGVFSGWGGAANGLGGLYRTFDRGRTWTRLIDVDRVTSLAIDPANPQRAFMTSEVDGLWVTDNLGDAAPVFTQVAEYPFRQPERVFFNPSDPSEIWVTSFGNGLRVGRENVAPPRRDLLRSSLSSLAPVAPALASLLPLDPVADLIVADCATGVLDPDATIVGDPARPLVFYDVRDSDGAQLVIRVSITPARRVKVDY